MTSPEEVARDDGRCPDCGTLDCVCSDDEPEYEYDPAHSAADGSMAGVSANS
jgi:hypothetical protein